MRVSESKHQRFERKQRLSSSNGTLLLLIFGQRCSLKTPQYDTEMTSLPALFRVTIAQFCPQDNSLTPPLIQWAVAAGGKQGTEGTCIQILRTSS